MKYAWMKKHLNEFSIEEMRKVLSVCASGFHAWQHREPSPRQQRREKLAEQIQALHAASRGT